MNTVTAEQREVLHRDGVVRLPSFVPADQLSTLDDATEAHLGRSRAYNQLMFGNDRFFTKPNVWKTDRFFHDFVRNEQLVNASAFLMRSHTINLLHDQIIVKYPRCSHPFEWHQDLSYAPIVGHQYLSYWISFGHITLNCGGMEFLPGSHQREEILTPIKFVSVERFFPHKTRIDPASESPANGHQAVSFDMEPGDALAFFGRTVHRSLPNERTDVVRKAYVVRHVGDDVRYQPKTSTGFLFDCWDAGLSAGDLLRGPMFPVLYNGRQHVREPYAGRSPVELGHFLRVQARNVARSIMR